LTSAAASATSAQLAPAYTRKLAAYECGSSANVAEICPRPHHQQLRVLVKRLRCAHKRCHRAWDLATPVSTVQPPSPTTRIPSHSPRSRPFCLLGFLPVPLPLAPVGGMGRCDAAVVYPGTACHDHQTPHLVRGDVLDPHVHHEGSMRHRHACRTSVQPPVSVVRGDPRPPPHRALRPPLSESDGISSTPLERLPDALCHP